MAAPDSANFRCRKALRYFVRSYVTSPTTINAITEIPAKTPSPIGRTDSFFPGIWNDASLEEAAEDADVVESAADVPPFDD